MGKGAKAKGSRYERELVALVDELGLPAMRVPLSGAMAGYKDDVVIADKVRVECKYRRDGAGFKRLHEWMPASGSALLLVRHGLLVRDLADYIEDLRRAIDGENPISRDIVQKDAAAGKTLIAWMGAADVLALRRANYRWLMVTNHQEE